MGNFISESRIRLGHLLILLASLISIQPASPMDIAVTVLAASGAWLAVCLIFTINEYQNWQELEQQKNSAIKV